MAKKKPEDRAAVALSAVSPADTCFAYKQVFATQEGQIVLADLMRHFAFCRHSTFVKNDPHGTSFNEGSRRVLMHIGIQIDLDPTSLEETEKVSM